MREERREGRGLEGGGRRWKGKREREIGVKPAPFLAV
jgi:hypothetical protein